MSDVSTFGGGDFSVDAQTRMFIEAQERERVAAANKRTSRRSKALMANNPNAVALSGVISKLENENGGPRRTVVGDDDDDSLADDWSLDSEESFYVGIERADYSQPNNLEMYGEQKEEDYEVKEDTLGISRVSVAIINRENKSGKRVALDWDADIAINSENGSSLHQFMTGTNANGVKATKSKKDVTVAMPLIGSSLEWNDDDKLGQGDDAIDQVYEHKAAEGKTFIDKIVGGEASTSTPGKDDASTVASMVCPPTTPGMKTPGVKSVGGDRGNYPVISPMALFSPGITTPGKNKIVEGEDNGVRQMREREIRKDANADANRKMMQMKRLIVSSDDGTGKVDASELMKQLEEMMKE